MPQRRNTLITASAIHALLPGDIIHDTKLKGFIARRQTGDAVSYALKTRVHGRQRWITIGRHGHPWTPETARKEAWKILGNPQLAEKHVAPTIVTFKEAAAEFEAVYLPQKKPSTRGDYTQIIRDYLVPAFGTMAIASIRYGDVETAKAKWTKRRTGNLALAVMSRMMTWAENRELRPRNSNPCRGIERNKTEGREVFLQPDEMSRLGAALDEAAAKNLVGPFSLAAIRLLLLTGARLNEILTLEWAFVDLTRKLITLPDSKTGRKVFTLNDEAVNVLTSIPRVANNPYVVVGHLIGSHIVNLQRPWQIVRAIAKLDHVRLHDLRHTFASYAVDVGGTLPVIGKQLGHRQPITTQRYTHLTDSPVHRLTRKTGKALARDLNKKPTTQT